MGGVPIHREDQSFSSEVPAGAGGKYSDTLTRDAKDRHIIPQPGGGFQAGHDEMVRGTAEGSVEGNQRGNKADIASAANAGEPNLVPSNYQSGYDFGKFGSSYLKVTGGTTTTTTQTEEEPPSEQSADLDAQLAEAGIGVPKGDWKGTAIIGAGAGEGGGPSDVRGTGGGGGTVRGAIVGAGGESGTLRQANVGGGTGGEAVGVVNKGVSGDSTKHYAAACSAEFSSTDPAVVQGALMASIGIDLDPPLTDQQKTALTTLASYIATQNALSPKPYLITMLQSYDPVVVAATLKTLLTNANTGLPDKSLDVVNSYLTHGAANLAACNASSDTPPPVDPTFTALNSSTSTAEVYTALLSQIDLTKYPGSEDSLKAELLTLAGRIADANSTGQGVPGIESPNADTIDAALTKLLNFESDTTIPSELTVRLRALVTAFSTKLAAINEQKWTQDSLSTDKNVVFTALKKLSNIQYDPTLSPTEKSIGEDYLKVLSIALAFMATVRARTAELEGEAEKKLSQGKLSIAKEQVALAKTTYDKTFQDIETEKAKIADSKKTQEIMKIVMPVVTALMAVISIAVTIITFGAAAPGTVAIMCVLIAATAAAMVAVQVTDAMNKMCDALGYPDPSKIEDPDKKEKAAAIRAAITMGVQMAAMIVLVVATLGAGAVLAPIMFGELAFGEVGSVAAQTSAKMLTSMAITTTASTIMTSGLLTIGVTAFLKHVCKASDDVAKYLGLALTLLLMIAMAIGCMQAGGAIANKIAPITEEAATAVSPAAGATDDAVSTATDMETGAPKAPLTAASDVSPPGPSSTNTVLQMMRTIAKRMLEMRKDPFFYTDLLEAGAQAMPQVITIVSELKKIEFSTIQKDLAGIIAQSQALIELLKQLLPTFDVNLQSLQEDAKSMIKFGTDLLNLYETMVQSASQFTTRLHQPG